MRLPEQTSGPAVPVAYTYQFNGGEAFALDCNEYSLSTTLIPAYSVSRDLASSTTHSYVSKTASHGDSSLISSTSVPSSAPFSTSPPKAPQSPSNSSTKTSGSATPTPSADPVAHSDDGWTVSALVPSRTAFSTSQSRTSKSSSESSKGTSSSAAPTPRVDAEAHSDKGLNTASAVGSIIGGIFAALGVAVAIYFGVRQIMKRKNDDIQRPQSPQSERDGS